CSVDRWLENKTWDDVLAWADENESQHNSDCGFFIRFAQEIGLDKYGQGAGAFLATGTFFDPTLYENPTIEGRNDALITRSGIYDGENYHDFDQANVREDHTHSFFRGKGALHPFEGVTDPLDPLEARAEGKYTWAKAPRYSVPGKGNIPLEVGPLARQIIAGRPGAAGHQDYDPLFINAVREQGPNILLRTMSRMHEAPKYFKLVKKWLSEVNLHEPFYSKPTEYREGRGFGSTEAARGSLSDWIVLKDGKIENYQVITPTAWNIGPMDGNKIHGPMEQAFIGSKIEDAHDPVELGHVARSFDSCLVCTVHAYDGKTGEELSKFKLNGIC
ncbi:MAG: nickel-dependent hydrogenase large subunit, partial [Anaerolineae bacterium]|nr:nickel-dependent hydrogenase large subunit [Anaerolineae bacterium]